jgi:MFS family permease
MAAIIGDSTVSRRSRTVGWGRFALVGLGTIVAAVLANVLVYSLGRAIVGYDPQFVILAEVGTTIFFTAIPALGATLLYATLLRFARRPDRTFAIIAAVVFVVATVPDFTYIPGVPGATVGQTATLVIMHIVAAVVIVGLLTRFARPQAR